MPEWRGRSERLVEADEALQAARLELGEGRDALAELGGCEAVGDSGERVQRAVGQALEDAPEVGARAVAARQDRQLPGSLR